MPKVPHQVADFIALPVTFQSKAPGNNVKHYIYLKAYEPKIPDEESPRAIFAVNIPVTSTEAQLRQLFTTQLSSKREGGGGGGGQHIQRIYFAGEHNGTGMRSASSSSLIATTAKTAPSEDTTSTSTTTTVTTTTLGKRKRKSNAPPTASELSAKLTTYHLPSTSPSTFHSTGSTAIIVLLDRTARDLALRACRKAAIATAKSPIVWPSGPATSTGPPLGQARYIARRELTFPSRADLLRHVDEYMTAYAELEGARAREAAKLRAEPDADGFVTVTRGSRGVVTAEEARALKERLEAKKKRTRSGSGLDDFYRFQMRERRKEEQGRLLRQFEADRRKVDEMRSERGRGKAVPES